MTDRVWVMRLAKAVSIVAALVLLVPVVDSLGAFGDGEVAIASSSGGIDAQTIIGDADPLGFVERVGGAADASGTMPPAAFIEEVGLLPGCRDVRVNATGAIVSYIVDAPADSVAAELGVRMAERGWNEVALGAVEGSTYVKDEGSCVWALATCIQVGSSTSVVFRCVYR